MTPRIAELTQKLHALEDEIEVELARRAAELRLTIDGKRIAFEQEVLAHHRKLRQRLLSYLAGANPWAVLTAPVIYAMIVPFAILDLAITVYQHVCFRAYGIPRVRRADYLLFDRGRLAYLNWIERFNCAYCSYGNGVIAYAREVAARTEQYWCPIKHARRVFGTHRLYGDFLDYGDADAYQAELESLREQLLTLRGT